MKKQPCVYTHTNRLTNELFYIGKSNDTTTRPYDTNARSARWKAYYHHNPHIVVTVIPCTTEGEALKLEWDLIQSEQPRCNTQYKPPTNLEYLEPEKLFVDLL